MDALLITFAEAELVGQKLHDYCVKMSGGAPFARDDTAWADLAQRVLFEARDVIAARPQPEAEQAAGEDPQS